MIFDNIIYAIDRFIKYELLIIFKIQHYFKYNDLSLLIYTTKYLTTKNNIFIFITFVFIKDFIIGSKLICGIILSRTSNYYIKNYYKALRPYNKFPGAIKYFKKKKKYSYSFPSQSIQNITIIYYIICPTNYYIILLYWFVISSLSITRLYRGLHYPHDIVFSYILCKYYASLINYLFNKGMI